MIRTSIKITLSLILAGSMISQTVGNRASIFDADTVGEKGNVTPAVYPVETVDIDDFGSYSASQLPEILNAETFVQFGNLTVDGFSSPYIDGINGLLSMVYFDGVPLFSPGLGYYDLKWFPMNLINSVDVLTGGKALLFGPGAIGGAMNIYVHEMPSKQDYTRLSGHWGNDDHRRLYGMFLKRFDERFGFGVSASEITEDGLSDDNHSARNRNFSAIIRGGMSDFDLRVFGCRHEGLNTGANLMEYDSLNVVRMEDDHRIFDAKLDYKVKTGDFSLRYNHQDYLREYFYEDETTFDSWEDNVDGVIGAYDYSSSGTRLSHLKIQGDYFVYTVRDLEPDFDFIRWKGGGNASLGLNFGNTAFDVGLYAEKWEERDLQVYPEISIVSDINKSYTLFASGGYGKAPPITSMSFSTYWVSDFDAFYTGEGGFFYRQGDGFDLYAKGFYTKHENSPYYILFDSTSPEEFPLDTLTEIYGVQTRAEYRPDELFLLGVRYNWNKAKHDITGLPEHFIQAYTEEKRFYSNDEFSITLRLEADGYLNLPDDSPDVAVVRCRGNFEYLGFSIFGLYEYALVNDEGWDNGSYTLTELMPGSRWRAGVEWGLID